MTADVIAPLVDDPFDFGRIAATNAISDVYAMGGEPRWALNLVFFPDELPRALLDDVLAGAARACREAGVAVVGGHSVRDPEPKFGLSVTGDVAEGAIWSNRGGRAGQMLVLSKALGTGVLSQAIKLGQASPDEAAAAIASMTTLNRDAMRIGQRFAVSAATDVTGFGLVGHLRNVLRGSAQAARLELAALPTLPGVERHLAEGLYPGGSRSNLEFVAASLRGREAVAPWRLQLACDAQTSGGLLLCVDREQAVDLRRALVEAGLPAAIVGELVAPTGERPVGTIELS
jgi:selenide,water dikinase